MNAKTILLVEDKRADELLIMRSLAKINLANEVAVVHDGQQALDYLFGEGEFAHRAAAPLPVIVLLDVNLPRLSGLDVLTRVRANPRTKLVPIVILTSSDDDRDRLRSYEGGANSFVLKPLDFGKFAETVARLGVYWVATNEPPGG